MSSYRERLQDAIAVFQSLEPLEAEVERVAGWCTAALTTGHKLLLCGNGGSSAEAQHLAGELMGRYKGNRVALPAVALSADTAILTCIGNDYCFDDIFARQVRALGQPGDVLLVFSTSGNSRNVLEALATAKAVGMRSVAFLGCDGGKARAMADCALIVGHSDTARAQEAHQFLMHALMDGIEGGVAPYLAESRE